MKVEHVRLFGLNKISPSPENQELYRPVTPDDDATIELAESIRERGILEPLVISADNYIVSGHRRHCAARLAGLTKVHAGSMTCDAATAKRRATNFSNCCANTIGNESSHGMKSCGRRSSALIQRRRTAH